MATVRKTRSKRKLTPILSESESEEAGTDSVTKNFCYTNIKVFKCNIMWTIENFSFWCGQKGEELKSSKFSADDYDAIKWCLGTYPKGKPDTKTLPVFLYLASTNPNGKPVKVNAKFSIINVEEKASIVKESAYTFEDTKFGKGFPMLELDVLMNKVFGWLPEDKLTIFCEVFYHSSECYNANWKNSNIQKIQFIKDIGSLYDDKLHSDVTLSVNGRQFNAHKNILVARSPVFAAMFTHNMKENDQNHVDIVDVDDEIFEEMLRFMYTDKVPNLNKNAKNLLVVANKYVLKDLKEMCEENLCSDFTTETAADLLIFADLHGAYQLKRKIKQFICSHLRDVIGTTGYRNMFSSHPFLVAEIVQLQAGAIPAKQSMSQ